MNLLKLNWKYSAIIFLGYLAKELVVGLYQAQKNHLPEKRFGNGTRDRVDEASWESFPASDAPGTY